MNYIKLINQFWLLNTEHSFTASDTKLYFYLIHTCNLLGWKMPFGHSDRHLAAVTELSVPTVRECKKRLSERGLLLYEIPTLPSKAFKGQCQYRFPSVQNFYTDTCTDTLSVQLTDTTTDSLTNTKQNKTKQDNSINPLNSLIEVNDSLENDLISETNSSSNSPPTKIQLQEKRRKVPQKEEKDFGLCLPFQSNQFSKTWELLLKMPKWKNKQKQSLEMVLQKLSEFDEAFAIQQIELAIANNWQGVIFNDTNQKYLQWKLKLENYGNETINKRTSKAQTSIPETKEPQRNFKLRL
jgi:hypothetical protein